MPLIEFHLMQKESSKPLIQCRMQSDLVPKDAISFGLIGEKGLAAQCYFLS
jgi:hypothetical protein